MNNGFWQLEAQELLNIMEDTGHQNWGFRLTVRIQGLLGDCMERESKDQGDPALLLAINLSSSGKAIKKHLGEV